MTPTVVVLHRHGTEPRNVKSNHSRARWMNFRVSRDDEQSGYRVAGLHGNPLIFILETRVSPEMRQRLEICCTGEHDMIVEAYGT